MLCCDYLCGQFHSETKIKRQLFLILFLSLGFLFSPNQFVYFIFIYTGESIVSLYNQLGLKHILNALSNKDIPHIPPPPTTCIDTHNPGAYYPPVRTTYLFHFLPALSI